jgi:hypothetical protein
MPAIWVCTTCSLNVEADTTPEKCPRCGGVGDGFALWATNTGYPKHVLGLRERQGLPAIWWEAGKAFARGKINPKN